MPTTAQSAPGANTTPGATAAPSHTAPQAPGHTAGPWKTHHPNRLAPFEIRGPGDIFSGHPLGRWIAGGIMSEANARILSAAPDLLAALRAVADNPKVMAALQRQIDAKGNHICGNIRAAIAKAEGQP